MIIHNDLRCSIYFGDARDKLYQEEYLNLSDIDSRSILENPLFSHLKKTLDISKLFFLKQVHGVQGISFDKLRTNGLGERANGGVNFYSKPFSIDGDFLVTNNVSVGLGVMTADCVPLVCYDEQNHAVGIAHAGWRGTVDGIAIAMVKRMEQEYKTDVKNVRIFFGPSARFCCYEVSRDFLKNLKVPGATENKTILMYRNNKLFFDGVNYNKLLLQEYGVERSAFEDVYALCTICDHSFFSYRRQGAQAGRQMSVVQIKPADNMTVVTLKDR